MTDFVANFELEQNNIEADFELENVQFDAVFQINPTGAAWGDITGNIENQTDLINILNDKVEVSDFEELSQTVTDNYNALDGRITINTNNISSITGIISNYGDIVTHNAADFATANQGALADTSIQPNDNITLLNNNAGYITNSALTPYALISSLSTVATSGLYSDLTGLPTIPTMTSQLTNNSGFITSADLPTNYITTDTAQDVSGRKTFLGEKAIYFKQSATTNKLGFTLYNPSSTELGAFEWRPSTIGGGALLNINVPYSSSNYVGFRYWGTAVNIVAPKVATAGNYYIPTHITNGSTTVTASNNGTVDISTLLPTIPTIGNGTITFTQGGVTKGTITANQTGNSTIALDAGGGGTVDQIFDGTSTNAQSGVAIAGVLDNFTVKNAGNFYIVNDGTMIDCGYDDGTDFKAELFITDGIISLYNEDYNTGYSSFIDISSECISLNYSSSSNGGIEILNAYGNLALLNVTSSNNLAVNGTEVATKDDINALIARIAALEANNGGNS